jgi:hypothetical protein
MRKHIARLSLILHIFTIAIFAPLFVYAVGDNRVTNQNTFQVKIPDGIYFYKSAPNLKQNEFLPLWIIEGGKFVGSAKKLKTDGLQFARKNAADKNFDVFSGKTKAGSFSKIELRVNNLCGSAQFLPSIEAEGYYSGNKIQPFDMQESKWGRQQRIFTSSRVFAVPQAFNFAAGADYLPVTEGEREALVGVIQKTLVPEALQKVSAHLVKHWGRKYQIIGQGKSGLVFLEKVDIDNNGKLDFIGTFDVSARYGEDDSYSVSNSILFVYMNGLELKQIAFSIGPDAFVLLGVMDVNLDGVSEIIYEEKIESSIDGGDPGVRIHLIHKVANGWGDAYRSSSVCDLKHYNFSSY